jgi:hypothetical protein
MVFCIQLGFGMRGLTELESCSCISKVLDLGRTGWMVIINFLLYQVFMKKIIVEFSVLELEKTALDNFP